MSSTRWIFIRGLTRGNIHWGKFPEILKEINSDIEAEFLEIPGNGFLNLETTPTDINQIINLLKSKSKFGQQDLPFNICGISLGGMIALKWAELYPQNIASVTIINSSLRQFSPFYDRLRPQNYLAIFTMIFLSDALEQEHKILEITSNDFQETQKYLGAFSDFARKHAISRINVFRQIILANSIKIQKWPKIPLKVIFSQQDRLVKFSCSEKIAEEFSGESFIHLKAGHDLPLDDPEWLCKILEANKIFV